MSVVHEVVLSARGDVAEHALLGDPPAEAHAERVLDVALRVQVALLVELARLPCGDVGPRFVVRERPERR